MNTQIQLTQTQMIQLRDIFQIYDRNASGKISLPELKAAMTSMGVQANDQALANIMAKYDVNHDSQIDFNEFCNLYINIMTGRL